MNYNSLLYGLIVVPMMGFAVEKNNGAEVGIGVGIENSLYYAIRKTEVSPFFALDLSIGNFYMRGALGLSEIGYEQPFTDNFSVSLFVNPFDGFPVKGKHLQNGYQTIRERKTQFVAGGRLSYDLNGLFGLTDTFILLEGKTGKRGISGGTMLVKPFALSKQFVVSPYIGTSYYSSKFTDYYFGIKQSELGGKITSVYKPKAAYATNIGINADYTLTENIGMGLFVGWDKYSTQIKHSPIIKRDSQITSAFSVYYTF